jgi:hypothetical protein
MAVYRFRIAFEEQDDVFREIDILGKQTYEEFHRAIQEAIGFDNSKDASFFMSDDFWRKGQEVALNPPKLEEDDDDDYPSSKKKKEIHDAKKAKVVTYIDDPHQKMIYVFDPQVKWTIMVELMKIVPDDPKANYPKTTKSVGVAPKQYKQIIAPPPVDDDDDVEDDEADKKLKEKIFVVTEAVDETDHVGDSEEGEEPTVAETEEGDNTDAPEEEEAADDFDPEAFGGDAEEF